MLLNRFPVGYAVGVLARVGQKVEGSARFRHMCYAGCFGIFLNYHLDLLILRQVDLLQGTEDATPENSMDGQFHRISPLHESDLAEGTATRIGKYCEAGGKSMR